MKPIIIRRKRVYGVTVWAEERGYVGRYPTHYNVLREDIHVFGIKIGSKELDREEVSPHDKIEAGALGGTRFVSRFAPFGRDGYLADA